jgi:hypothetical protein
MSTPIISGTGKPYCKRLFARRHVDAATQAWLDELFQKNALSWKQCAELIATLHRLPWGAA